MASRYQKGLSIKQILSWDYDVFDSLNEKQLRGAVTVMVSAANKRLKAMERAGEKSPAYRAVQKSAGVDSGARFSVAGKSFSELRSTYTQLTGFLTHKTSTLSGWKKVKSETVKEIKKVGNIELSPDEWDDFWEAYDKLEDLDPDAQLRYIKYDVFKAISDAMSDKSKSPEDIAIELGGKVNSLYENKQKLQQAFESGGVSELFDGQ